MKWNENNQVFLQSGRVWNDETLIFIEKQYISGFFRFLGPYLSLVSVLPSFLGGREWYTWWVIGLKPYITAFDVYIIYYMIY